MFRASTNTGLVAPRIFLDDTPEDKQAIQSVLELVYRCIRSANTTAPRRVRTGMQTPRGFVLRRKKKERGETQWVFPEKFVDKLSGRARRRAAAAGRGGALRPGPGVLIDAANRDPKLKAAIARGCARRRRRNLVKPLFEFRNCGQQLPHHWSTISNEADFGTDYFTRTAVAKVQYPRQCA